MTDLSKILAQVIASQDRVPVERVNKQYVEKSLEESTVAANRRARERSVSENRKISSREEITSWRDRIRKISINP